MEPSIYAPLTKGDDTIFTPEQRLWISVVMQCAIDAASTNPKVKREVIEWMRSEDFEIVCDMAGMSPAQVRHDLNAILGAESQQAAFRKAMSFRFLIRSYIEDNLGEIDKEKDSDPDILMD
jgi:predicted ATP-grasp superfamily ATP-dependent carboligase